MRGLFDGAMGTELMRRGLTSGDSAELWNLHKKQDIEEIHRSYVDAGSDLITLNTFGANKFRLKRIHAELHQREIITSAVALAKRAASPATQLAASVGPLGEILEPIGNISRSEAYDAFREMCAILLENGIRTCLIETMTSLDEALVALTAARDAGFTEVFVTLNFDTMAEPFMTPFGDSIESSVESLASAGATAIGANCVGDLKYLELLSRRMRGLSGLPLIIQPNAGIPEIIDGQLKYPLSPEDFASFIYSLAKAKIDYVGGCCGTTPQHIEFANRLCRQHRIS